MAEIDFGKESQLISEGELEGIRETVNQGERIADAENQEEGIWGNQRKLERQ